MNLTHTEAKSYFETFLSEIGQVNDVEIVIIPPFTAIPALVSASEKVPSVWIGAQNMHWDKSGAFTGEVSAANPKLAAAVSDSLRTTPRVTPGVTPRVTLNFRQRSANL